MKRTSIYKWHISSEGSGGLVLAEDMEEAERKIYDRYDLDDFAKKNLNISSYHKPDYESLEKEGLLRTSFGRLQEKNKADQR